MARDRNRTRSGEEPLRRGEHTDRPRVTCAPPRLAPDPEGASPCSRGGGGGVWGHAEIAG